MEPNLADSRLLEDRNKVPVIEVVRVENASVL
jgi:hypothetical protein